MRREFRPTRPTHAQAGMAGPERSKLVAEAIAKANLIMHQRIAQRLLAATPETARSLLERAQREVEKMSADGSIDLEGARYWTELLSRPAAEIASEITAESGEVGDGLRAQSPFRRLTA